MIIRNDLDFTQESREIVSELTNMFSQESSLTLSSLTSLQAKISLVIEKLNMATEQITSAARQKNRLKTLKKSIGYQGALTRDDFLAAYYQYVNSGGKIKSRTLKSRESVETAFNDISQDNSSDAIIKKYVLDAYNLIMSIRNLFKEHIEYRIFIMGKVGNQDLILMGNPEISQLVSGAQTSSSQLSIQLEYTGIELQNILNEYMVNNSVMSQWSNILQGNGQMEQAWQVLLNVKEKMKNMTSNGKKIYYSFGQLIEALVYLQDKDLTSANIYNALRQGKNTTPFEVSGDFNLDGVEIQSKAFSTYNDSGTEVHRIRLMNLSGVKRVLHNIQVAINNSISNPATLKNNLEKVFADSGKETAWNVIREDIEKIAQETIDDLVNKI